MSDYTDADLALIADLSMAESCLKSFGEHHDAETADYKARLAAAEKVIEVQHEALRWLVNVNCHISKDGGAPHPGELREAIGAGKCALADHYDWKKEGDDA